MAEEQKVVLGKTTLYERQLQGLHVEAYQQIVEVPVEEGEEGTTTQKRLYYVDGFFNGEQVHHQQIQGYRQTIQAGRKVWQNLHAEHVKPIVDQKAEEEAAAKEAAKQQKQAERKAAKAAKEAEKQAKAAEKQAKAEADKKAAEEAAAAAEQEATQTPDPSAN